MNKTFIILLVNIHPYSAFVTITYSYVNSNSFVFNFESYKHKNFLWVLNLEKATQLGTHLRGKG